MKFRELQRLRRSHVSGKRRGAALVEFAIVLPVIVLLLMGSLEMGRTVMVRHVLEETARAGCRVAAFENGSRQDVLNIVATAMDAANIDDYAVTINPEQPQNLAAFQAVTVSISVLHSDVSWLPSPNFMSNATVAGTCVMPAEGDGAMDPDSNQTPNTDNDDDNDNGGGYGDADDEDDDDDDDEDHGDDDDDEGDDDEDHGDEDDEDSDDDEGDDDEDHGDEDDEDSDDDDDDDDEDHGDDHDEDHGDDDGEDDGDDDAEDHDEDHDDDDD